jgi:hypothetical protein
MQWETAQWNFWWVARSCNEGRVIGLACSIWGNEGGWWIPNGWRLVGMWSIVGCNILGAWTMGAVNMYPTSVHGGAIVYYAPSSKIFMFHATWIFVVVNFSSITVVMSQCNFVWIYYCICSDIDWDCLDISFRVHNQILWGHGILNGRVDSSDSVKRGHVKGQLITSHVASHGHTFEFKLLINNWKISHSKGFKVAILALFLTKFWTLNWGPIGQTLGMAELPPSPSHKHTVLPQAARVSLFSCHGNLIAIILT